MWQAAPLIRKNYWVDFFMYWYFCDLFQDVQNRGYDAYPAAIQHYSRGIPSDLISIKDTDDYLLQLKSLALNGSAAPHRPAGSHGQPCTWAHIVSCYPPGTGSASHRTDIPSPGDKQKLRYEPNASDPSKRLCTSTRFPIAPASSGLGTGRSAASEGLQGGLSLPAQPRRQWNPMCKNTSRKWVRFTSNYPVTLHEEGTRRESLESCNRTASFRKRGTVTLSEALRTCSIYNYAFLHPSDTEVKNHWGTTQVHCKMATYTPDSQVTYSAVHTTATPLVFHRLCFPEWFTSCD